MKTVTIPVSERSGSLREVRRRSCTTETNRAPGSGGFLSKGLSGRNNERRRSSASSITIGNLEDAKIRFCPLPKKGFFYSRAYREHKKKRKEKKNKLDADNSDRDGGGSGNSVVDDDIPLKRDLTRRKRNSFHRIATGKNKSGEDGDKKRGSWTYEPTNVTAYLAARVESEKPDVSKEVYNHSAALLHVWEGNSKKDHMMDISIFGNDGIPVKASKFILACYSSVLEEIFYKQRDSPYYDKRAETLVLDFCNEEVVMAAAHHCFSGELPATFGSTSPSESVARNLAQLDHLAHLYKFSALGEVTYRALRKLINRRAVLACAIFDELSYRDGAGVVDSIKRYALDTMREMPMDTLLGGGVQWMKEESLEAIMQDQDMDVDEFYMFKILKAWSSDTSQGDRLPVACRLSQHIELKFIEPELLETQVKKSEFYDEKQIIEAVKLIKDSLETRDPCEMERVLVEGAGTELVNGIYCRVNDEIGMSEEEILFVKEADDGYSDVGLYLWGSRWHIAMCTDYSNCFYSCEDPPNKPSTELVPGRNWSVMYGGLDPPPYCTYLPNTRLQRLSVSSSGKSILAPNLEEMMDPTIAEKRRSGYFDRRTDDVSEKRTMTLEQMMHLPEDIRQVGKE